MDTDTILMPANVLPVEGEIDCEEDFGFAFDFGLADESESTERYYFTIAQTNYHLQESEGKWIAIGNGVVVATGEFPIETIYKVIWPNSVTIPVSITELRIGDHLAMLPFFAVDSVPNIAYDILAERGILRSIETVLEAEDDSDELQDPSYEAQDAQEVVVKFLREPLTQESLNIAFQHLCNLGFADTDAPSLSDIEGEVIAIRDVQSTIKYDSLTTSVEAIREAMEHKNTVIDFTMNADADSKVWVVRQQ